MYMASQFLKDVLSEDGGELSHGQRKESWPVVLGISKQDIRKSLNKEIPYGEENVTTEIKNLVKMDVARVLKRFPPGLSESQQDDLQIHLSKLIIAILNKNPNAHYYQGFHDISLTVYLVCVAEPESSPYLAYLCLDKMVETCLAPFLEKTMEYTHELIHVLFAIIESEDTELYNCIVRRSKCPAAFSLPWVLTWFSHTLPNDNDVFRVYDFVFGCLDQINPSYLVPIFISAALVLRNSVKLKAIRETDLATMHHALATLPSQLESLEPWLKDSLKLMRKYKGKEMKLIGRAAHIKELQNQLWDADNNANRVSSSSANRGGVVITIGRFIFVKHRWYTLALALLGTAYLLQSKYGPNPPAAIFEMIKRYVPDYIYENVVGELGFGRP